MSNLVDERIVEMRFDNEQFEKNVKTSTDTINKLKSSLNFSDISTSANKSFDSIDASGLNSGLAAAAKSFSLMEIVAITAISNITNKVVDLGLQIAKSLSVDQISAGWDKFGQKTTSVATLTAQGFDPEIIDQTLEKLLWYTDETSYSFTDMVDSISKFTAAGQGLEESTQAMMGIANWAALSGQNASTASRAMYQLSQAMGAGVIRMQDWKSIQNANMDTREFRQQALDAAVAMGTLTQSIDGTYQTLKGNTFSIDQFTSFLTSDSWFTSDVLIKTLGGYSGAVDELYKVLGEDDSISTASEAIEKLSKMVDENGNPVLDEFALKAFRSAQEAKTFADAINATRDAVASKWMTTFENIFGNYEEAKVLWTDLANELWDVFAGGLEATNEMLSAWKNLGGRNDLFENTEESTGAFWNIFYALVDIKDAITAAWQAVFPPKTAEQFKQFTESLKEWTAGLRLSEESASTLSGVFKGLFSIIKLFLNVVRALWTGIKPVVQLIGDLVRQLFGGLSLAGNAMSEFVTTTNIFTSAGQKMAVVMQWIADEIRELNVIGNITNLFRKFANSFKQNGGNVDNFGRILNALKAIVDALVKAFMVLYGFVKDYIFPIFGVLIDFAARLLGAFGGKIVAAFAWVADVIVMFLNFIKTSVILNKVFSTLKNAFSALGNAMSNFFGGFRKIDTSGLDEFNEEVPKKFSPLETILQALSSLFTGLWSIIQAFIPIISKVIKFIGDLLKLIGEKLSSAFGGDGGITLNDILSMAFLVVATKAIFDFIGAFKNITRAIGEVISGLGEVLHATAFMQYAKALQTLAISILILVGAMILLSLIDDKQLKRGLMVIAALLAIFVIMIAVMKSLMSSTKLLGAQSLLTALSMKMASDAIQGMAIAVLLMVAAIMILGKLDQDQLLNGLTGIILIVAVLLGAAAIIGKNQKTFSKGAKGLIGMAIAVLLLSSPLKSLGALNPQQLIQGILGITALVALILIFSKASGRVQKAITTSFGLLIFANALLLAAIAIRIIGGMGLKQIGIALLAVVALSAMVTIMGLLGKKMAKAIISAMAMLLVSAALLELSVALLLFSLVKWSSILKAMVTLAAIMAILSVVSKVLGLKSAISLVLLGVALIPLSIGLLLLVAALKALGLVKWKDIGMAMAVLGIFLVVGGILMTIAGALAPFMILLSIGLNFLSAALIGLSIAMILMGIVPWASIGKTLLVFAAVMAVLVVAGILLKSLAPTLLKVASAMLLFSVSLLIISVALGLFIIILAIFGKAFAEALGAFAEALAKAAPKIAIALGALLRAILQAVTGALDDLFVLLDVFVTGLIQFLKKHGAGLIDIVIKLLADLLISLARYLPSMLQSLVSMIVSVLEAIRDAISKIIPIVLDIVIQLLDALMTRLPEIIERLARMVVMLVEAIVRAIVEMAPRLVQAAFDLILGLVEGLGRAIKANAGRIKQVFKEFALNILDAILIGFGMKSADDPNSTEMTQIGESLIDGLWNGIKNTPKRLWEGLKGFCGDVVNFFKEQFGIKSPSRVMKELGGYIDDGLALGIEDGAKKVFNASLNSGNEVIEGFKASGMDTAVRGLYNSLNQEMEDELVIRPVMDLTDIQNGTNQIFGMMGGFNGYSISGSNSLANQTAFDINSRRKEQLIESSEKIAPRQEKESPIVFNNTYTINGAQDPQLIADRISQIQQQQINRRRVQYGKLNI